MALDRPQEDYRRLKVVVRVGFLERGSKDLSPFLAINQKPHGLAAPCGHPGSLGPARPPVCHICQASLNCGPGIPGIFPASPTSANCFPGPARPSHLGLVSPVAASESSHGWRPSLGVASPLPESKPHPPWPFPLSNLPLPHLTFSPPGRAPSILSPEQSGTRIWVIATPRRVPTRLSIREDN